MLLHIPVYASQWLNPSHCVFCFTVSAQIPSILVVLQFSQDMPETSRNIGVQLFSAYGLHSSLEILIDVSL
jgi:hypothetical protein